MRAAALSSPAAGACSRCRDWFHSSLASFTYSTCTWLSAASGTFRPVSDFRASPMFAPNAWAASCVAVGMGFELTRLLVVLAPDV